MATFNLEEIKIALMQGLVKTGLRARFSAADVVALSQELEEELLQAARSKLTTAPDSAPEEYVHK